MELNPAFRYIFFAFAFFNPNKKKDAAAIRAKRLQFFGFSLNQVEKLYVSIQNINH